MYCGVTTDIARRLRQHNAGTASKYTRSRLPIQKYLHVDGFTKSEALRNEHKIKRLSRPESKAEELMFMSKGRTWGGSVQ